jgi:hypothetical protein
MKPISRNMSKIMYVIWALSITPVNPAEGHASAVRRKGRRNIQVIYDPAIPNGVSGN